MRCPGVTSRQMQREVLDPDMLVSNRRKVDHRNRNALDCRKENLRWATDVISNINRRLFKSNTTGYRGVVLHKGKYRVQIRYEGGRHSGGQHLTIEDAARAYNALALIYHGEDAQFNDVPEPRFHHGVIAGEIGIIPFWQKLAAKTHCIRGHPLAGDNLRRSREGSRICITCSRQREATRREQRRGV